MIVLIAAGVTLLIFSSAFNPSLAFIYCAIGVLMSRYIWGWRSRNVLNDIQMAIFWPIYIACALMLTYFDPKSRSKSMVQLMREP